MPVLAADDEKLNERIDALRRARQRFTISVNSEFRHQEALIRVLDIRGGARDRRGFFRGVADAVATGDIMASWTSVVQDDDYSWDYAVTEDGVTITLDPDPNALRPKLSAAFKNKPRKDHGFFPEGSGRSDNPIISIHDADIKKKIIALTSERRPFVVQADHKVRHKKAMLRWLSVYDGAPEKRGFGRMILDNLLVGRFNAFMQIASDAGYAFSYRHSPDLITIAFEPPENRPSGDAPATQPA